MNGGGNGGGQLTAENFDCKKRYKELYLPKPRPALVEVPTLPFFAADGSGPPEGALYREAIEVLYALSFTVKMSKMGRRRLDGYYEYAVPPLETLWWLPDGPFHPERPRREWQWRALIAQPDFVDASVLQWAAAEVLKKKPQLPTKRVAFTAYREGSCVQALHIGDYSEESRTMAAIAAFLEAEGWRDDSGPARPHHEIYLSDPRRTAPEKRKTVLRVPVSKRR